MRYALIGCGRISSNHLQAAINNQLEIVGLCDLSNAAMESKADQFGLDHLHFYMNHRELLEREKPDLVAIATPSGSHASIALDCIQAGCYVIIEKPMALSLKDADALIAAAQDRGVHICVCHQNRFNKSVQYIRSALEAGRFGRLLHGTAHVRWNRQKNYYEQASWRGTWSQDGGCMMNQAIHNLDLLRWMMGDEIDEVMAYTGQLQHDYIEGEDLGLAMIRFSNGAYGLAEGTTNVYPRNLEETLYLFGEKGTVKAGGISNNIIEEWHFSDGLDDPEEVRKQYGENPPDIYGYGHTPLYADVLEAINKNRPCLTDGKAGRRALELVLAMYQSAAEHRPVRLPLESGSTLDYVGRFDSVD